MLEEGHLRWWVRQWPGHRVNLQRCQIRLAWKGPETHHLTSPETMHLGSQVWQWLRHGVELKEGSIPTTQYLNAACRPVP